MSTLSRRQLKSCQPFIPLKIIYRDPKQLKKNPYNARTHSEKQTSQIQQSIKAFNFTNPILIDEDDGIIAGHGRHGAAIAMSLEKVPTITLRGLTEAQRRAYALADNKLALNGGWDIQILTGNLEFLSDATIDFDISVTGFETVEIDNLIAASTVSTTLDDSCPALLQKKATSQPGDIWVLGGHRVICGDATNAETYAALLGNELARMAFLDAPYNGKIDGHVSGLGRKRHREFLQASGEMSPRVLYQVPYRCFYPLREALR